MFRNVEDVAETYPKSTKCKSKAIVSTWINNRSIHMKLYLGIGSTKNAHIGRHQLPKPIYLAPDNIKVNMDIDLL